jgi:hypothetical protein
MTKMKRSAADKQQLRRTAAHEAGHATCAFVLGVRINGASIESSGGYAGRCWVDGLDRHGDPLAEICILFGGPEAEKKWCLDRCITDEHPAGNRFDLSAIRRVAADAGLDHREVSALQLRAQTIIDRYWHAVRKVALDLRVYKTLGGDRIEQIIADAIEY